MSHAVLKFLIALLALVVFVFVALAFVFIREYQARRTGQSRFDRKGPPSWRGQ